MRFRLLETRQKLRQLGLKDAGLCALSIMVEVDLVVAYTAMEVNHTLPYIHPAFLVVDLVFI